MSDGGKGPEEERARSRKEIASAFDIAREDPLRAEELLREVALAAPDDATVHWALARFLHDVRGDIDDAAASYRRALELDAEHVRALSDYARLVHYHRSDLDQAERLYERAVRAAPNDASVISDLAHFIEHDRRDLDRAEALYERAIAADPSDVDALDAWARFLHHARRDAERARVAYRRAVEASPERADLRAWNAVFLQTLGADPAGARAAFEEALALDPSHGFALSNYALFSWSHDHDLDRADALFERAVAVEPDRWSTHWWRAAFLHEARGDRARAAEHYRRAVELQPAHATLLRQYQLFLQGEEWERSSLGDGPRSSVVDAISDRGWEHEQDLDLARAQSAYVEALDADPDHGPTLRRYASLLERDGSADEAEKLLRRAVALAPRDGWAHGLLARFLARERRALDEADEHYRQAIAAGLHDPKWLGEYARFLFEERGDRVKSERYWQRALQAGPSTDVVIDFARSLETTRPDEAERLLRLAIERSPDDVYPLRQFARFLEEVRSDLDEAELYYARAVDRAPADALSLDAYARFLDRRREDDLRAGSHYLRAARAEPMRASRWAVVARFLIERGLVEEARGSLRRWIDRAYVSDEFAPRAEALFYGLVYFSDETERAPCFEDLKDMLAEERDLGRWDPTPALEHLKKSGRPDVPWVERLAATLVEHMR